MSAPTDWGGLALSIDLLNAAIAQDVQVGDARVVILNRDSARQVRDAAENWVRDYGKVPTFAASPVAGNPLDARSTANMLDYHRRQLARALLAQAEVLEAGTDAEMGLHMTTARIAAHLAVIDYLAPPEIINVMAEPRPSLNEVLAFVEGIKWTDEAPTSANVARRLHERFADWRA